MKTSKITHFICVKMLTAILTLMFIAVFPVFALAKAENKGPTTVNEAQGQGVSGQPAGTEGGPADGEPDLADIIPSATMLSGRLMALEKSVSGLINVSTVTKKYTVIETNLKGITADLEILKKAKDYRYRKLVDLRDKVKHENKLFEETSKPLNKAIRKLGYWRNEWLAEKKRWDAWKTSLLKKGEISQFKSTFEIADNTLNRALAIIHSELNGTLTLQEKAGYVHVKIYSLDVELNGLVSDKQRDAMFSDYPPMFSSGYFTQLKSGLWSAANKGLSDVNLPDWLFFTRHGWIIIFQGLLSLFIIIGVYRNRRVLNESERWHFLAKRPFAAGLFIGFMTAFLFYVYEGVPAIWEIANMTVIGISFARLSQGLIEESWKRRLVYGLVTILIVAKLIYVVNIPLPLTRLYTFLTAALALFFCLRWAKESGRHDNSKLVTWLLRLIALFFAYILIAELRGKVMLAGYLFISLIDSIATVLVFMMIMYMIHGGVEWLFRTDQLRRVAGRQSDNTDVITRRITRFIDQLICVVVLIPGILMIWRVYNNLGDALQGLLALGFNLGSQRYSVGLMIISLCVLYGSFLVSWIVQKMLMDGAVVKHSLERGVRHSIARLLHYVIMVVGFLVILSILGFEITQLTIIMSAFGVGIGFGLQNIVNNFISGLILLFEQPVRVGDVIELGGNWAEIKRIGLRATTVQTYDQADVIMPNSDLISNQVTNWTLSSRRVRLTIPVGVAYGSDISLVMEKLTESAEAIPLVADTPAPQVLFLSFGESSLEFQLRVWVLDADERLPVKSELHQMIDENFREANIEIAFPQRDLHLRSIDDSVILRPQETKV